jgi:hypothetical protein
MALGLLTRWGITRYWWVSIKLVLNLAGLVLAVSIGYRNCTPLPTPPTRCATPRPVRVTALGWPATPPPHPPS